MAPLANPALAGSCSFDKVVYAASGVGYGAVAALNQFTLFDHPTAGYTTRKIDVSHFADLDASVPWPFSNADVPINGIVVIPRASGPFPLAIFAHGNHDPTENSTPGYLYLCELLASHGVVAATIDCNFLNGGTRGENDGRAIVHLEHVRQFVAWNNDAAHPLYGKVDVSRIMLIGHSRGGEAVGHASLFNGLSAVQPDAGAAPVPLDGTLGLGPYKFPLQAIVAIAPTDGQYVPVTGPTEVVGNYFILHGSRDNDVFYFPGYQTYDRTHPIDLTTPLKAPAGYKSLLWIHGANHNYFNSVWPAETPSIVGLTRAQQKEIAKVFIGALAQAELLGARGYLETLRDHQFAEDAGWLPGSLQLVSQHQPEQRQFVQHFEEPGTVIAVSAPTSGTVDLSKATARKLSFDLGPRSHLFEQTFGLRLDWVNRLSRYVIKLDPASLNTDIYGYFCLRLGQSTEPNNLPATKQDLTLEFEDSAGTIATVLCSRYQTLWYPDNAAGIGTQPKTVMQTVRIPLSDLRTDGVDTGRLRQISLVLDQTDSGTMYLDDLQVCT